MNGFSFCILKTTVAVFVTSILYVNGHEISGNNEVSYERAVYKHVMEYYTPSVRPVRNDSDAVDVQVQLTFYSLEDLDEVNQAFQANGWLYVKWNDFQLSWQPEEFGNVGKTRVQISKLWFPDITVLNSLDTNMMLPNTLQSALVYSSGDVRWFPSMKFRTYCALDLTHFPFDEQKCSIRLGSWTYHENEVNTSLIYESANVIFQSSEWEPVKSRTLRHLVWSSCCTEPYVDLEFAVSLRRRPTFASHLFVGPSVILCLITPTVFALPPAAFEKLTLGSGILVGHVLLLGELINFVRSAHPTVPLMGKFFVANIVMVSLSLAISVVVLNLWSRSKTRCVGPPSFIRTILLNAVVRRVLLIDLYDYDDQQDGGPSSSTAGDQAGKLEVMTDIAVQADSNTDDRVRIIEQSARAATKLDWRRLAVVVDRFFFVVFAVIVIVTCLSFTGYL